MRYVTGVLRAVVVAGAGAGLVVAASRYSGSVELRTPAEQAAALTATTRAVGSATLLCPGPQTLGLTNSAPVAGSTAAYAVSPPPSAYPAASGPTPPASTASAPGAVPGAGSLAITALGAAAGGSGSAGKPADPASRADRPGIIAAATTTTATALLVTAEGSQAPGLTALQAWLRRDGDSRGLIATTCQTPGSDLWLVGGGGQASRRERVVIANPGAATVTVTVEVHGVTGRLTPAQDTVDVPARSRVSLLLDALVPGESAPAVRLTSTGDIAAVLSDSWIDGAIGRGAADAVHSAPSATKLVVPGIDLAGTATLRLVAPTADTIATLTLLTATGPRPFPGGAVVRIPSGASLDVPITALPAGSYAVQLTADHPVLAAAAVERRATTGEPVSDFGWVPATPVLNGLAGTPTLPGATATVHLAAETGGPVTVTTVDAHGIPTPRQVRLAAGATTAIALPAGTSSVWVYAAQAVGAHAAMSVSVADPAGPLFDIAPLLARPMTTVVKPLRSLG